MKVVILAGGYGTRIRDVSEDIPKPMIPIGPYPILWHIMKTYSKFGITDFIICLGYKGQAIKDFFLNYEAFTRDFTISFGKTHQTYPSRMKNGIIWVSIGLATAFFWMMISLIYTVNRKQK